MTTSRLFAAGLCGLQSFVAPFVFSQGTLTPPPGAPAPTMKSLDQVEARTIVNAANTPGDATNTCVISAPGSYYLTGNITGAPGKHGISIQANDVTLDLNGFALISGGGGATRGVNVPAAQTGFHIVNGSVRGWTDGGVRADAAITLAEGLSLTANTGAIGLAVGNGSLVKDCVASANGTGFFLPDRTQISNCISTLNTGVGFNCTSYVNLIDCTSNRNASHGFVTQGGCNIVRCSATRNFTTSSPLALINGIETGDGCNIVDCVASANGWDGIHASSNCGVRGCTSSGNGAGGISVIYRCYITNNTCDANFNGIHVIGDGNRVDGNSLTSNSSNGILCDSNAKNLIVRNDASGNGTNYTVSSANALGAIIDVSAGGAFSSSSSWANFVH